MAGERADSAMENPEDCGHWSSLHFPRNLEQRTFQYNCPEYQNVSERIIKSIFHVIFYMTGRVCPPIS